MKKLQTKLSKALKHAKKKQLPAVLDFFELIEKTLKILREPYLSSGVVTSPQSSLPVVVVPDIHGRFDFFKSVLEYKLDSSLFDGTVLQALEAKKICLCCVGDGVHGEGRVKNRWLKAFEEYVNGSIVNSFMVEEMSESLAVMTMVMELKCAFPNYFHFLKGNHENILNEEGRGNHPFRKFALEGDMVYRFMVAEYGFDLVSLYSDFEHALPLVFCGSTVLVSHAQPKRFFSQTEVSLGRDVEDVVTGLTWTGNGEADDDSVKKMLDEWLPNAPFSIYIGGHRPVVKKYALLSGGYYVQLHNPDTWSIAIVSATKKFNPEEDIVYTDRGECDD